MLTLLPDKLMKAAELKVRKYLQSACKHHILGDNSPCSKIYDKENSQM